MAPGRSRVCRFHRVRRRGAREWKAAIRKYYDRVIIYRHAGREHRLSDALPRSRPHLPRRLGPPLLRITFDWEDNERKMAAFGATKIKDILQAAGADIVAVNGQLPAHYDTAVYQSTHNTGGAIMGADPRPPSSTTTARCGTSRTSSSSAPQLSRKTLAGTRPERLAHSPTARRTASSTAMSRRLGCLCRVLSLAAQSGNSHARRLAQTAGSLVETVIGQAPAVTSGSKTPLQMR